MISLLDFPYNLIEALDEQAIMAQNLADLLLTEETEKPKTETPQEK
ncbi:MAG: hypothetical protein HUU01_02935 [Saprospiraceae bacterium]|nr:hypothetical protein [Saprospiraceae bacterium]